MKKAKFLAFLFFFVLHLALKAQTPYLDHNPKVTYLIDRLQTLGKISLTNTSSSAIQLEELIQVKIDSIGLSKIDRQKWQNVLSNIPERYHFDTSLKRNTNDERKGFLNAFYRDPFSFYELNNKDFFLKIDPVFHFGLGDDSHDSNFIFQNTRGIKIRGIIDKKVYFYTSIFENQQRFVNYVEDEIERLNAIPGQGFFKPYQSGIIDRLNGWDFLNATSYAGIKVSKSIDFRMGHGRHNIGNGMRSLLLSDYANNYFYLQFNTKIWKLHYQNTFAELAVHSSQDNQGNSLLPKKYMATHYLNFKASPRFSIGLFETVIFSRENNFEFQYLNPVILYRSVEQFLDSPDNALLGLNVQWIPKNKWQLYGQLLIDELKTSEAFSGQGWWGNKIAYQIGMKKFDLFGIDNLDIQLEHNTARPYTYAHRNDNEEIRPTTSYSHFNQPLAHPYGANFRETLLSLKYRFSSKLNMDFILLASDYGDNNLENVGRDILSNYETRTSDYNNFTGQGIKNSIRAFHFNATYELTHNYFLDINYINRSHDVDTSPKRNTNYIGFGFRANVFNKSPLL